MGGRDCPHHLRGWGTTMHRTSDSCIHILTEWTREPVTYHSMIGTVWQDEATMDWLASVQVGERVSRLNARYDSAPVAMMAVERTWQREYEKLSRPAPSIPHLQHPNEVYR